VSGEKDGEEEDEELRSCSIVTRVRPEVEAASQVVNRPGISIGRHQRRMAVWWGPHARAEDGAARAVNTAF
jgi:hypothetical protein